MRSGEYFELERLKHVEIRTAYTITEMRGLSCLLNRSPALETLVLDRAYQFKELEIFFDNFLAQPFHFDIPSLREVKMKRFKKTNVQYFTLSLFGIQKVVLNKVVLVPERIVGEASPSGPVVLDLSTVDLKDFCFRGYSDNSMEGKRKA